MSFWSIFWPELAAGAIAMVLGVGIGVPAGIALDRLIRGMRLKEENRLQNQIMATYLQALKAEIRRNLFRLEEQTKEIISYH